MSHRLSTGYGLPLTNADDENHLAQMGYTPQLVRDWGLLHNFGASFSIIVCSYPIVSNQRRPLLTFSRVPSPGLPRMPPMCPDSQMKFALAEQSVDYLAMASIPVVRQSCPLAGLLLSSSVMTFLQCQQMNESYGLADFRSSHLHRVQHGRNPLTDPNFWGTLLLGLHAVAP